MKPFGEYKRVYLTPKTFVSFGHKRKECGGEVLGKEEEDPESSSGWQKCLFFWKSRLNPPPSQGEISRTCLLTGSPGQARGWHLLT